MNVAYLAVLKKTGLPVETGRPFTIA